MPCVCILWCVFYMHSIHLIPVCYVECATSGLCTALFPFCCLKVFLDSVHLLLMVCDYDFHTVLYVACRPAGCRAEEDIHQMGQLIPGQGASCFSAPCLPGCVFRLRRMHERQTIDTDVLVSQLSVCHAASRGSGVQKRLNGSRSCLE